MELYVKKSWIIVIFSFVFAKDYYISFSFSSLNYKLNINRFNCVKALVNKHFSSKFLFKIPALYDKVDLVCKYQKEDIILYLLKSSIYSFSMDKKNRYNLKTYSKITYPPKLFDIIIKDGYAYFYIKGDE